MNVEIGICPMIGFGYNRIKNTVNKDGEEIYNKNMHVILLPFLFILIKPKQRWVKKKIRN